MVMHNEHVLGVSHLDLQQGFSTNGYVLNTRVKISTYT